MHSVFSSLSQFQQFRLIIRFLICYLAKFIRSQKYIETIPLFINVVTLSIQFASNGSRSCRVSLIGCSNNARRNTIFAGPTNPECQYCRIPIGSRCYFRRRKSIDRACPLDDCCLPGSENVATRAAASNPLLTPFNEFEYSR